MEHVKLSAALVCLLLLGTEAFGKVGQTRFNSEQQIKRAAAAIKSGNYVEAAATYERVLEQVPDHAEASLGLSWTAIKRADYKTAARVASSVIRREPANSRALALLGMALLRSGMILPALEAFRESARHNPDEPLAIAGIGEIHMFASDMGAALQLARRAVSLSPREPDFLYLLGQTASRQEQFEEAADAYRQYLLVAPDVDKDRREKIQGLIQLYYRLNNVQLYAIRGERTADIPFSISGRTLPVVEVKVNGREKLRFVLDTGSGFMVVSEKTASRLGIKPLARGGTSQGVGGTGKFPIIYGLIRELDFGTVRISNVPTYVRKFHHGPDEQIDGFIGLSLLSRFRIAVDYRTQRLELRPQETPAAPPGPADLEIPFHVTLGGMLSVPAVVENATTPMNFIVDTGASSTVISKETFETIGLANRLDNRVRVSVIGAGGVTDNVPVVVLDSLAVRDVQQRYVRALVLDLDPVNETAGFRQFGILGGNFLRHYRLEIDFPRGVIILRPHAEEGSGGLVASDVVSGT